MIDDFISSVRKNFLGLVAFTLAYAAITLNLGPAYAFLVWFVNGCAYIIFLALRRD